MSRPYSQKFIDEVMNSDSRRVGVELAQQCIRANLPAKYVAKALGVSRATIHNWFRGSILRGKNEDMALAFIRLVKEDTANGILPVKSNKDAKDYISDMIGQPV